MFGAEQIGELIAVIYPLALYKLITSVRIKQKIFAILFVILLIGAVMTGTRSINGLILFSTILVLLAKTGRLYKKKIIILVSGITITTLIILFFSPFTIFDTLFERAITTFDTYKTGSQMDILLNRQLVWPDAWSTTINTLSLFGHGPSQAAKLGLAKYNFHNLYLSLIFQFGVVGSPLFIFFFMALLKKMLGHISKDKANVKLLKTCCILSLLTFLINEIKFEFNRGDSYQQLVFVLFSIYFLCGKVNIPLTKFNHQ